MTNDQTSRAAMHKGPDPYLRFAGMIATSTVVMFVLTYTNVFDIAHVHFSQERLYMAILMGSAMAIVMLAWMWRMHPDRGRNVAIVAGALVVGVAAFLFSQTQTLVADVSYMRGMIPHHSIAILTSGRAGIEDLRVRELADAIIEAQRREIAEMEWLIRDIEQNGAATTEAEAAARPVPSFEAAP
ncbi:MAG TPA: DUF305 domain-containing protein [Candidatus Limnocylindrales bacterium]|nr:DUF305 domain-containing protein [Candidatus Limnocylindrales bacterium]